MNLYGQDMDENVTPFECGLSWTVDLRTPREFIGRSALENAQPRYSFFGLVLDDRGVMRSHQRVRTPAGEGEITSGGFSPTMNRSIALARLPPRALAAIEAEVSVRDKWLKARVVRPPFVRNGKVVVKEQP
jgi:aminomethyltransferase